MQNWEIIIQIIFFLPQLIINNIAIDTKIRFILIRQRRRREQGAKPMGVEEVA